MIARLLCLAALLFATACAQAQAASLEVLVECSYSVALGRPKLLVYDLAARTFTDAPGTEILTRGAEGSTVTGIGRTWISFGINGHRGGSTPGMLNWHTGQAAPAPAPAFARDRVTDLDRPSATRRICSSIRRPARRRLFAFRAPYALVDRGTASRHAAAWVDGTTIRARSLRTGRAREWRAPLGKAVLGLAEVGRRLLVMIQGGPHGGDRGFGFTVYSGRLP